MNRLFAVAVIFASGSVFGLYFRADSPTVLAGAADDGGGGGAPSCSSKNGDVNGNGAVDLSDAVTVLNFLFLGNPTQLVALCPQSAAPSGLPDTGQWKCYDEAGNELDRGDCFRICPGQDSVYATGCPSAGRFADNDDGTVTDNCTGLIWQKDTADVNGDGELNHLDFLGWCDALAYCENLSFAGHDDWRLPNVRELQSIVDYGRENAAIDPVFGALPNQYWSSTSWIRDPGDAWYVFFVDGQGQIRSKVSGYFVRAVRSGP